MPRQLPTTLRPRISRSSPRRKPPPSRSQSAAAVPDVNAPSRTVRPPFRLFDPFSARLGTRLRLGYPLGLSASALKAELFGGYPSVSTQRLSRLPFVPLSPQSSIPESRYIVSYLHRGRKGVRQLFWKTLRHVLFCARGQALAAGHIPWQQAKGLVRQRELDYGLDSLEFLGCSTNGKSLYGLVTRSTSPPSPRLACGFRGSRASRPSRRCGWRPFVYHNLCGLAHSFLCHNPASEFLAALTLDEISIPQLTNDLLNRLYRQSQCISKLSLRQIRLLAQKAQYLIPTFIPTLNPTFFPYLICFTLGLQCPI